MENSVVTTTSEGVIDSNIDDNSATAIGNGESGDPKTLEIVETTAVEQFVDTTDSAQPSNVETEAAPTDNDALTWEKVTAEVASEEYLSDVQEKHQESELQEGIVQEPEIQSEIVSETIEEVPETSCEQQNNEATTEIISEEVPQEIAETATVQEPDSSLVEDYVDNVVEDLNNEVLAESIEISEFREGEPQEGIEVIDGIQYTVIETEADNVETHELIQEHLTETGTVLYANESDLLRKLDDSNKGDEGQQQETVVEEILLVQKEFETEEEVDEPDPIPTPNEKEPDVKLRKPRGRKPISDIPLHVLGRDINKPASNGGRIMPKPRLGVKVPYRNLTSQIVSKEEIQKEIMDRYKQKQEQIAANSGDVLFTRRLTKRLAKKLMPDDRAKQVKKYVKEASTTSSDTAAAPSSLKTDIDVPQSLIQDDSDLIAILEGDDDEIKNAEKHTESKEFADSEKFVRDIEKEIALKQLRELPSIPTSKNRIFKSRGQLDKSKTVESSPVTRARVVEATSTSKSDKKSQPEVEPQIKSGMVVKTYTRKRKSFELESVLPSPKKITVVNVEVKKEEKGGDEASSSIYMTKSSRVIKKKVIWDPDESPSLRNTIKSPPPKQVESPKQKPSPPEEKVIVKTPTKKSPGPKPSPTKKTWKRLSEIDKLLMDEGAVNMMYDVKNNDDANSSNADKRKKSKVISVDKKKELMSKANTIRNDFEQDTAKEPQKSLRGKKEGPSTPVKKDKDAEQPGTVTRKKSKDSTKSSVHSPPMSPAYNAYNEGSRLIRRHSSSSFSSGDELSGEPGEKPTKRKSSNASDPPKKKTKKISEAKASKNNNNVHKITSVKYETFTLTKINRLASIELNYDEAPPYFTEQVLTELTACLHNLEKDANCHVVSLTSSNKAAFCYGLDYKSLVSEDDMEEDFKQNILVFASLVEDFLRCLLHFPKVLVAGIQGECVGLGVTMLPLFDMVVASDTSTFRTPYGSLGCVPEGGFLLTTPHLSNQGLASELLYTGQVMKADDAFRRGLLTRLCWPEKYDDELKGILTKIAEQSQQSLGATKDQLRQHLVQSAEALLNGSSQLLADHWISAECQKNFVNYKVEVD